MLLRDRLIARLADMGAAPDYCRLAEEVLGIRHAPPALAERLVRQALVMEDRREEWRRAGERICAAAPQTPGVYVLRDGNDTVLYVGKAINLRRRLRAHFAIRRWKAMRPEMSRAAGAEWREVGSEIEALVREAEWIRELAPIVNTQVGAPAIDTRRIPSALVRDTLVLLPSIDEDSVELLAARADGPTSLYATRRNGHDLAVHTERLWTFFRRRQAESGARAALAPIVFSWLAGRGAEATRIDVTQVASKADLRTRLATLVADRELFSERIVVLDSLFRHARRRA